MSYDKRGVSSGKEDVHSAIKSLDKGLFPNAFCKILPDVAGGDEAYCNIMHADTAGTKTALAYLYWKETGNTDVWKGICQDALVMNFDDMACSGAINNFIVSSTIGRNRNLVSGEVVKALIEGTFEFISKLKNEGINVVHAGGETADVGDIVRTADVGFTFFSRLKREEVIEINIKPGDVIVGFESYGQSTYEKTYNSGIGSNGLTFARHEMLSNHYSVRYPESFDPHIEKEYVYTGKNELTDSTEVEGFDIGQLLLSPTRTYLPLLKKIIESYKSGINGIIHNSGGGQTKVLHFIEDLHVIKNNLIPVPPVFKLIQKERNSDWKELFKVFNMGQRLEIYTNESTANSLIYLAREMNIHAQITGYVERANGKMITLDTPYGEFKY